MPPRRLIRSACACVVAALLIAAPGCGDEGAKRDGTPGGKQTGSVPEGGSAFGTPEARTSAVGVPGEQTTLLDSLAPLLEPQRAVGREQDAGVDTGKGTARLRLPLARAAARVFLVGFAGTRPSAGFFPHLRERGWGGIVLERGNFVDSDQLTALAGEARVVSRRAGNGVPLVAVEQLGGEDSALPGLPPRPQPVASTPQAAGREAARAGRRLRKLGVGMTLGPSADLAATGGAWEGRAFSDDPGVVTGAIQAAQRAYRRKRVIAAVGHFPGEGGASQDPGAGPATVGLSLDELRAADLKPFAAVARRSAAVQMSAAAYAAFDGVTPATAVPEAVALLREQGFKGVVVSADLAAATIATGGSIGRVAVDALAAGCDLLYVPGDARAQDEAWRAVTRALRTGELKRERVADALARVGSLKRRYGLAGR
jgi:beta-N-acetylhexosaminidase